MITVAEEYHLDIVRGGYKEVDEHNNVLYIPDNSNRLTNKVVNSLSFWIILYVENIFYGYP